MGRISDDTAAMRAALEHEIDKENAALSEILDLLAQRVPLDGWRQDLKAALAGAVLLADSNRRELAKAGRLSRYLFGGFPLPLNDVVPAFDRLADRLRADLLDLAGYGAGLHLVDRNGAGGTRAAPSG